MFITIDLLVSILSRRLEIWSKYFFNHGTLHFGIARNKVENISWRVNNLSSLSNLSLKNIFIHCGINNK